MVAFACPGCGKRLEVKDEFAGRATKCPGCARPLIIPTPTSRVAPAPAPAAPARPSLEAPQGRTANPTGPSRPAAPGKPVGPGRSAVYWVVPLAIAVVGLCLVCPLGIGVWWWYSSRTSSEDSGSVIAGDIVGKWKLTKGDKEGMSEFELECTGDHSAKVRGKDYGDFEIPGAYRIDGKRLIITLDYEGHSMTTRDTIKKLTDTELVLENDQGGIEEYRRVSR